MDQMTQIWTKNLELIKQFQPKENQIRFATQVIIWQITYNMFISNILCTRKTLVGLGSTEICFKSLIFWNW